jgi:two-component system, sensor histidine kinase and response regulator
MQEHKAASQGPRVDLDELLSRLDNDKELLSELVTIFKEDFPRHLRVLREAVARQDAQQVRIVSHTLKGMLSNLAVTQAASAAAKLEQLAIIGTEDSRKQALATFEREVDGLLPEMESYVTEAQL